MHADLRPAASNLLAPRTELAFSGIIRKAPLDTEIIDDITEFYQGKLPNGQFLAAVQMVLLNNPTAIEKLKGEPDKRGRYTIRFPGAPEHPIVVHPKNFAPVPWRESYKGSQVKGHEDIRLIEAAYAKLLMAKHPDRFRGKFFPKLFEALRPASIRKVYTSPQFDPEIFNTGFAYKMLTGKMPTVYAQENSSEQIETLRNRPAKILKSFKHFTYLDQPHETPDFLEIAKSHLDRVARSPHQFSTAFVSHAKGKRPKSNWLDWGGTVNGYDVYVLKRVDEKNQTFIVGNPKNTRLGIEFPIEDIPKYFFKMYVAENTPDFRIGYSQT